MTWAPGPARCRSAGYEAEIAFTDMGGDYPLLGRARRQNSVWRCQVWDSDGRATSGEDGPFDLMPPTITREALAEECQMMFHKTYVTPMACWLAVVAHVIDAVKAGRVE